MKEEEGAEPLVPGNVDKWIGYRRNAKRSRRTSSRRPPRARPCAWACTGQLGASSDSSASCPRASPESRCSPWGSPEPHRCPPPPPCRPAAPTGGGASHASSPGISIRAAGGVEKVALSSSWVGPGLAPEHRAGFPEPENDLASSTRSSAADRHTRTNRPAPGDRSRGGSKAISDVSQTDFEYSPQSVGRGLPGWCWGPPN